MKSGYQSVGLEFEGIIVDEHQKKVEDVDELNKFRKNHIGKETTKDRIEIRSDPHNDVKSAFNQIISLIELNGLSHPHTFLPFNEGGNLEDIVFREGSLAKTKKLFLGENYNFEGLTRGTHIHFGLPKNETKMIKRYNLLLSLDPFSISLLNSYSETDNYAWRINGYRKKVYENNPFFGELPEYMNSLKKHNNKLEEKFNELCEENWNRGGREYFQNSNPTSSINGPLRLRLATPGEKEIGYDNTIELRAPDANPLWTLNYAYVDILHWLVNQSQNYNLKFSDSNRIELKGTDLMIPNHEILKELSDVSIRNGLNDESVLNYCESIVNTAVLMGYDNLYCLDTINKVIQNNAPFSAILNQHIDNSPFPRDSENGQRRVYDFVSQITRDELNQLKKRLY